MSDINEDDFAKKWGFAPSTSANAPTINEDDFAKKWEYSSASEPATPSAAKPQAAPAPQPAPDYTTYEGLSRALAPAPNTTYGELLPLARDNATGSLHFAMPGALRTFAQGALDLAHGPQTGAVTPEGTAALATIVPSLNPSVAAGTYGLINGSATRLVPGPNGKNILAAPQDTANPLAAASQLQAPFPTTSAEAKLAANGLYKQAEQSGGILTPQFTNKFIDSVTKQLPQTEAGKIVGGESPVSALVDRIATLKDKPLSLPEAQEIDEALGGLISKEYSVKGLTADGKKIQDIQSAFRDQIANAGEGDVEGGSAGFGALSDARKAWSQAMKMRDLERIQERANMTDNPQTSVKTQLRAILTNPAKLRGYSSDEVEALKAATKRGALGSLYHVFGSRLAPLAAGAAEFGTGGLTGGVASAAAMHYVSAALRNQASKQAAQRLSNAMQILGRNVPQNPLSAP